MISGVGHEANETWLAKWTLVWNATLGRCIGLVTSRIDPNGRGRAGDHGAEGCFVALSVDSPFPSLLEDGIATALRTRTANNGNNEYDYNNSNPMRSKHVPTREGGTNEE
jgi:hypothetical protein